MRNKWKKNRGFMAYIVVTLVFLFFFFENYMRKSKILNKAILRDIHNELRKINIFTDYITKAKATNLYPCKEVTMPQIENKADYWQPVHEDVTAFVFSAFFSHETKKIVVIAIRKQVKAKLYFCQFWFKGKGNTFIFLNQTHARRVSLPRTHGLPYAAELFECRFHPNSDFSPMYASIVDKECTTPRNILNVQHVTKPDTVSRNFTLCLPPLYGNTDINRFVEWIEFNRMLGADMLFVYNYTSNIQMHNVLYFYSNKGFINIVNWNLPKDGNEANLSIPISVHYYGQIAALNDCLYRNKYESEFIVNVDLDEFIIPHVEKETTWHQMFTHVNGNESVYIVQNTFFWKNSDVENIEMLNKTLVENYNLITLQNLYHENKIFSPERRSKYFARTSRVSSLMIHTVLNEKKCPLPVNIALMHHYRYIRSKNGLERTKVLDRTVPEHFGDALIKKVGTVWLELNKTGSNNVKNY